MQKDILSCKKKEEEEGYGSTNGRFGNKISTFHCLQYLISDEGAPFAILVLKIRCSLSYLNDGTTRFLHFKHFILSQY